MYEVLINYTNGETLKFNAQEFNLDNQRLTSGSKDRLKKLSYKDANGNDTPIYLTPDQVSGIVVTPID